jgi:translation initiation factor IF-2
MGHVDHGKTSLVDRIRSSKIADDEHGGITQHIGAYSVKLPKGKITFLDTPGHEAFTAMRSRGANITDIVVIVIAADEGIMPQTVEAIDHARAAGVPIMVALNKIDKKTANPDRVKKQLSEIDLMPEDWGGKTVVVGVSAITGQGIDDLLELILLESELLELRVNAEKNASGIVIEAHISKGRGAVASLIVQSGTLREGDMIVVGPYYGKVKALFDDHERPIKEAGPSTPVEILGLSEVPSAGEKFYVIKDEKKAKEIAENRAEKIKADKLAGSAKISLEDLYAKIKDADVKEMRLVIKTDVQGSLEAIKEAFNKIPQNEVKLRIMHGAVGDVNTSDVLLALASEAVIIAFNVRVDHNAQQELEKSPVDVREYRIIYDAVEDVKKALEGMLAPKIKKIFLGRAEVRQVFKLSKGGIIAGSYIQKGKIKNRSQIVVLRNGKEMFVGNISSLKRFKDDVKEVGENFECGIGIDGFPDVSVGDLIEAFDVEHIARKL